MSTADLILSSAQVLFAGALVIVTIIYTYYTAKSAQETKLSREVEVNPVMKPNLEVPSSTLVELQLDNVGKGAARDVEFVWEVGGEKNRLEKQLFRSGEKMRFPILTENQDDGQSILEYEKVKKNLESREGGNKLVWEVSYTNLIGERHVETGQFDVIKAIYGLFSPRFFIDKKDTGEMADTLEDISDKLDDLQR